MKKIIGLWFLLLLIPLVIADMDVGIGIITDEDLNAYIDLEAGGDLNVWINDLSYEQEVSSMHQIISDSSRSMSSIYHQISQIFMFKKTLEKKWYITDESDLGYSEQNLRWVLENYMLNSVVNMYEQRIQNMEYEILSLQKLHSEDRLCKAKMEVAKEHDMESVKCNGDTYISLGNKFITLTDIEPTEEEKKREEWNKKLEGNLKKEREDRRNRRRLNNTQSYIDIICPNGNWTKGKCLEVK